MFFMRALKANLIFLGTILTTLFWMKNAALSDDQITYLVIAKRFLGIVTPPVSWNSVDIFSYFLAGAYLVTRDFFQSFLWVYALVGMIYLNAARACFRSFFKDEKAAVALSLISIVPHYTLGMTYWGFAGFEYIKGRILFMPLAVLVLKIFFAAKEEKDIHKVFLLCAAGGILSYEAFYLLGLLILYVLMMRSREGVLFSGGQEVYSGMLWALAVMAGIYFSNVIIGGWYHSTSPRMLWDVYEKIILANRAQVLSMSHAEYVRHYWEAAYKAFWWTMFPPKGVDLVFAFGNSVFLIFFGVWGAFLQKKEKPAFFRSNVLFLACAAAISYVYQAARFFSWKFFLTEPVIFEEVRAFKFSFFPLFLFIGSFLIYQRQRGKKTLVLCSLVLMFVSPLEVLRGLPQSARTRLQTQALRSLGEDGFYRSYLSKALNNSSLSESRELEAISEGLQEISRKEGRRLPVLSDRHELESSGQEILVTYHDKRWHTETINGEKFDTLVYWHLAYEEISRSLREQNIPSILRLAAKYGCNYVVMPPQAPLPKEFRPVYEGTHYGLYRIENKSVL